MLVLDHARRVGRQSLGVDHAVEVGTLQRHHDVVGVALDLHRVFICTNRVSV